MPALARHERQRPAGIPPLAVAVLLAVPCYFLRTTSSALAPLGFTAISAALLFDSGIRPPFVVGNRGTALRDIDPSFAPVANHSSPPFFLPPVGRFA